MSHVTWGLEATGKGVGVRQNLKKAEGVGNIGDLYKIGWVTTPLPTMNEFSVVCQSSFALNMKHLTTL